MIQYNDYELLYLMNEFDEEAESILYDKYMGLIKTRVYRLNVKERYIEDYVQEGLYMLLIAIRTYDENCGKTFNKYFEMILNRRLYRLVSREKTYLNDVELIDDEYVLSEPNVFVYEDSFNVDENLSTLEKKVLILKEKNYRPKDIANKLGCDVKSVYNCLCRIKDKIKR